MRTFEKLMILLPVFLLLVTFVNAQFPYCEATDPPTCNPLDNSTYPCGYDPVIRGETTCPGGTCVDSCFDDIMLDECYCETPYGVCQHMTVDCVSLLGTNGRCINGACVLIIPDSCEDTDGGNEPFVQGNVYGYLNGEYYSWPDFCYDDISLQECICVGTEPVCLEPIDCKAFGPEYICRDGACVPGAPPICEATDPPYPPVNPYGNDPYIEGHTICQGGECDDFCLDYRTLEECYCEAGNPFCLHESVDCYDIFYKVCYDGACRDPACIATDPPDIPNYPQGNDPFIGGSTICEGGPCVDRCIPSWGPEWLDECLCPGPTGYCAHEDIDCNLVCSPRAGECRINSRGEGYCYCYTTTSGGCPTLFVYDGKGYVKERKSRIHSQEGVDTVDEIVLKTKLVAKGGVYSLSLKETTLPEHSYIDSVKLFVGGEEAKLISAMHSKYGDVTSVLKESDDERTDTKVFDSIELKFKVPELNEPESFLFTIEGYNPRKPVKLDIAESTPMVIIAVLAIIVVIFAVMKFFAKK